MYRALIDSFFGSIDSNTRQKPHRLSTSIAIWRERARSRRLLREMDDRQLKDIGISREQASAEARRSFWDGELVPHWRHVRKQ